MDATREGPTTGRTDESHDRPWTVRTGFTRLRRVTWVGGSVDERWGSVDVLPPGWRSDRDRRDGPEETGSLPGRCGGGLREELMDRRRCTWDTDGSRE